MTERTIQVSEAMADFIEWANGKGEDEIRRMVREHVMQLKEEYETSKESRVNDGFKWDNALEPNDDITQYKHGGDCNLCKRGKYCLTKCRPNKLLKRVTTPWLYQKYLEDVPEAAAKAAQKGINTEALMRQLGVLQ